MDLPQNYKESMRILLKDEYDAFIRSYEDKPYSGIRINTSKISCEDFEKIAPYHIRKIPYISNGYYIDDTDGWSKHPYYYAGLYYIQEPSAMLPARILPVVSDDIVCDLCAAPGGKSTELACLTDTLLLSNDISHSRAIPLVKNMEMFGRDDYMITCQSPEILADRFCQTFDKILVDAPCSGEGMFRKDKHLISSYENKGPEYYSKLQREILECAYKMLCPGGKILYSTCTFSDIEDEQVILDLLLKHSDLRLETIEPEDGLCGPYDKYSDEAALKGCVHAFPHKFKGEGHFAALIAKTGMKPEHKERPCSFTAFSELPDEVISFADFLSDDYMKDFIRKKFVVNRDGYIFMIPDHAQLLYDKSIRYLRCGICIGRIKKGGHFTVHTAFALSLKSDDFVNRLDYQAEDPEVIKYLKGETLIVDGNKNKNLKKGYVLVCADSYPLGFAYSDGKKLKNLYEKGWVYR